MLFKCVYPGKNRLPKKPSPTRVTPGDDSIDVNWGQPEGSNIAGYRLDVGTPSNPQQFSRRLPADARSLTVDGLDPDTDYQVNLVSTSPDGESEPVTRQTRTGSGKCGLPIVSQVVSEYPFRSSFEVWEQKG